MFRFLVRFLGLWSLAGAFVALVIDGTRSIAASRIVVTPVIEAWLALQPISAEQAHETVEQNLSPWIWENLAVYLVYAPLWLLLGVLGALLLLLGRPRPRPIGYSSRD